jgi:hypothetical protein
VEGVAAMTLYHGDCLDILRTLLNLFGMES